MSNDVNQENSSLTIKEKKTQIIKKITAAIIIVMRTANLVSIFVTIVFTIIDINNEFSKQFKSENIEFFNLELDIEKDTIITDDKF